MQVLLNTSLTLFHFPVFSVTSLTQFHIPDFSLTRVDTLVMGSQKWAKFGLLIYGHPLILYIYYRPRSILQFDLMTHLWGMSKSKWIHRYIWATCKISWIKHRLNHNSCYRVTLFQSISVSTPKGNNIFYSIFSTLLNHPPLYIIE